MNNRVQLTKIYINRLNIQKNKRKGLNLPVVCCETASGIEDCHEVSIEGPSTVVYRPDKPLPNGVHVWIETRSKVIKK